MLQFMFLLVSLAFAVARVIFAVEDYDMHTRQMLWFRDAAHFWCGMLFMGCLVEWVLKVFDGKGWNFCGLLLAGLIAVELIAALLL